jgi:hypothetical protein
LDNSEDGFNGDKKYNCIAIELRDTVRTRSM